MLTSDDVIFQKDSRSTALHRLDIQRTIYVDRRDVLCSSHTNSHTHSSYYAHLRNRLEPQDVFADIYRVLATNCDNDTDTLRVVERMQMFLTRVEVQRTLTTARKPMRPVKPTVVERFENGFLLRWCASKADDEKQALHFHYELQYGFRYTGSWKAVHVVEDTEYRLTDLKPGTSYMVRVRALNPKGWSTFSETIQVTTLKPKNGDSIAEKGMPSGFFGMIGAHCQTPTTNSSNLSYVHLELYMMWMSWVRNDFVSRVIRVNPTSTSELILKS